MAGIRLRDPAPDAEGVDMPNRKLTPGVALHVPAAQVCTSGYAGRTRNVPSSEKEAVYARYGVEHVPYKHEIDLTALHQMPAGVIGDDGVGHAVLAQFPRGQFCSLVARARLVHPHMERDSPIVRGVKRRRRSAIIDARQPACVAVGEHIDRPTVLPTRDLPD